MIELYPTLLSNEKDSNKANDKDNSSSRLINTFFQSILKLHSAKSMFAEIYIRSRIRKISYELIFTIIPVLVFIVIVGNITSPTQKYNSEMLRILYSIALSIVFVPIFLLARRIIVIFFLLKANALTASSLLSRR